MHDTSVASHFCTHEYISAMKKVYKKRPAIKASLEILFLDLLTRS